MSQTGDVVMSYEEYVTVKEAIEDVCIVIKSNNL